MQPDRWSAAGCDVNAAHVRWCAANLGGADVREVGVWPPCPYEEGAFDLVYCLSVFTHLPEERALAWLADLARVLSPGGILVATTSGVPSLETIRTSRLHQEMFRLEAPVVVRLLESFETEGFRYFRYDEDVLRLARAGEDYGNAFVHPEHVRRRWLDPRLELIEHRVGGLHAWQDVVVWRRR